MLRKKSDVFKSVEQNLDPFFFCISSINEHMSMAQSLMVILLYKDIGYYLLKRIDIDFGVQCKQVYTLYTCASLLSY